MNKALEISDLEKGKQVAIQGEITYSMEPRQYGKSISQFVVIQDETGKQGCNISLPSMEDKLENGSNVHVEGVVDKYPDKKNPNPDGSLPIATSVKGRVMEHYTNAEDFPYGANVGKSYKDEEDEIKNMQKAEEKAKVLPAKSERQPVELRNQQKVYTNNDYWKDKFLLDVERQVMQKENNKLIVRECAIKAATEITSAQLTGEKLVFAVDGYLKLADIVVDWINTNSQEKERITERDLILSGAKTKAEIIDYIEGARKGTPYERDDEFYVNMGCQVLTHQTKPGLIATVEKFEELLKEK